MDRKISIIKSNPKYNANYLENIVKTKWLQKLNEAEMKNKQQLNMFDIIGD